MAQTQVEFMFSKPPHLHPCVAVLHVQLIAKKPPSKLYPKALLTLGDHIRKKRLDLNLHQIGAAKIINVNEMTIVGWELNYCKPLTRHIPKIIDFLGYVPENLFPTSTTGQKVRRYRLLHGISRKQLAKQLHIDEHTLCRLEMDKGKTSREIVKKITGFLRAPR
ncbi:MAG TPA: helix-turn-helix transcriptional regulator [Candidatus Acidoferrales bacterium]|nr:helix-turn-helix transcriptional regulator [Candidatus Acidoferrales bacterium]